MSSAPPPVSAELTEARELAQRRDWVGLVARLRDVPEQTLLAEPELAFLYADACRRIGETATALTIASKADPLARRAGDRWLVVNIVNLLGMTLFDSGQLAAAADRFDELLEHATNWEDEDYAARAANNLGTVANVRGQRDLALMQYQRAIAGYTRIGNRRGLAQTYHNVGISYRDLGFESEADSSFRRAISLAEAADGEDVVAMAELERAMLRAKGGDPPLAIELARLAQQRFERIGDPVGVADAERVLAAATAAQGQSDEALAHFERALAIARSHADVVLKAEVQRDRGRLLRDLARIDEARAALTESVDAFAQLGAAAEAEALRVIIAGLDPEPPG